MFYYWNQIWSNKIRSCIVEWHRSRTSPPAINQIRLHPIRSKIFRRRCTRVYDVLEPIFLNLMYCFVTPRAYVMAYVCTHAYAVCNLVISGKSVGNLVIWVTRPDIIHFRDHAHVQDRKQPCVPLKITCSNVFAHSSLTPLSSVSPGICPKGLGLPARPSSWVYSLLISIRYHSMSGDLEPRLP